jgi:hypothetical protein
MTLSQLSLAAVPPPLMQNVPDRVEAVVRNEPTFFAKIDANKRQIFRKFELPAFI